ncbi:acidic mammalian chitinase, partial [Caerostris darwini]
DFSVNYWINAGAAREKLIVGLATYGHSYTLRDARQTGVHAPSVGPGTPGPYVKEPGVLGFNEVCMKLVHDGWVEVWDGSAKVPYAYKGNQWVSYDNQRSIGAKVDYLLSKGLGGAMVWSLDMDDFRGACYGKRFYLVSTAANKLL